MKASYIKKVYIIPLSLESYPSTRFIKGERDVNNVYASLQIQNLSIKETGGTGCRVVFVDPRNTSKMCSRCGNIRDDLTLWDRVYTCPNCGLSTDRDLNAAVNILIRATPGQGGSNACNSVKERDVAEALSVKQEAHTLHGWEYVTISYRTGITHC